MFVSVFYELSLAAISFSLSLEAKVQIYWLKNGAKEDGYDKILERGNIQNADWTLLDYQAVLLSILVVLISVLGC